jgi:branched-chain amino acid transport system substrate-binding protein
MFALALLVVAPPALRVGAVFNVTGSFASTDGPGLRGLQLAASRYRGAIEVVPIDTRSDVKQAAAIVRKAIRAQRLDVLVGLYDSDYALVVGREAQRAKIPFVTSGATLPGLTKQIGEYAFAVCYGDDDQARAMAAFALKHLKRKDALVAIDRRHAYTRTVGDDFARAFRRAGAVNTMNATQPGNIAWALGMRSEHLPDAIYAAFLPEDAVAAVRTIRRNYKTPILSGDGFDTPDLWSTPGLDTHGVYFTTHVAYNAPDTLVQEFVRGYHQRYGKDPESAAAALAFDSLGLVAEANRRRGKSSLRDAIAQTKNFPGVTGVISYGKNVREPNKPITIIEIAQGRPIRRALINPM